jgi:proliferating cell nuclear antigen
MFYARLKEGNLLKKIIDSIKDLVNDINLDITGSGISLQAMDSSHVALVTLQLNYDGFEDFRCDKQMTVGINISHFSKIMKCAGNEDTITLRAEEENNFLHITFENRSKFFYKKFYKNFFFFFLFIIFF